MIWRENKASVTSKPSTSRLTILVLTTNHWPYSNKLDFKNPFIKNRVTRREEKAWNVSEVFEYFSMTPPPPHLSMKRYYHCSSWSVNSIFIFLYIFPSSCAQVIVIFKLSNPLEKSPEANCSGVIPPPHLAHMKLSIVTFYNFENQGWEHLDDSEEPAIWGARVLGVNWKFMKKNRVICTEGGGEQRFCTGKWTEQ